MADYYPLIAKAVSGLEKSTGEARRALYDRARAALLAQLRGVSPALNESDITRERLALEEAIRKVEAEAARRSRTDPPPAAPARPEPQPRPEATRFEPPPSARSMAAAPTEPADDRIAPPAARTPAASASAARTAAARTAAPPEADGEGPVGEAYQVQGRDIGGSNADASEDLPTPAERQRWTPGGPSLSDRGLKGFRDVVAETETLGGATAQAANKARASYASAPPARGTEAERLEPRLEPRSEPRVESDLSRPLSRRPSPRDAERALGRDPAADSAYGREQRDTRRQRNAEPPPPAGRRLDPPAFDDLGDDPSFEVDANHFESDVTSRPEYPTRAPSSLVRQQELRPRAPVAPRTPRPERREPTAKAGGRRPAQWRRTAALVIAGLLLVAVAVLAVLRGPAILASFRGAPISGRTSDVTAPGDAGGRAKISDRIGAGSGSANPSNGALVAQKVVLYEEDPSDPLGKRYVGSAVWRTDMVSPGAGQPAEMAVRADIEIPDQKMTMRWSLRRNDDKALPASHTVEIMFTLPPDFPHGGISSIPGVLMKQAESTRGVPLAGLAVKVTTNFFLIGLSSVDAEMQRNIQMLKERSWFDIPIVYNDGKRAIIAIEKGTPGDRTFADAFAAWGQ